MLTLKNIKKNYKTGSFVQHALNDVDLEFSHNEFVSILGPSGSGKTTLLNIIGGLDRYDSGDLIINNKSTKKFKDKDWDNYRNNCIGFIFQNYNLINHISVLNNVEMSMTLSGVKSSERRKKAREVLKLVGLLDHADKRPNQLSGGQMQRVAIARALVNDPDIILADEPTGALDSKTSEQILELIKKISKDKLVIMVTHNDDLAYKYASRIIKLKDGKVTSDDEINSDSTKKTNKEYKIRKTSMSFLTALKLSFNNIITKKGRTILTSFASSIGIIGIALILSLSNGFDIQINKFEKDTLSSLPIMVTKQSISMDASTFENIKKKETFIEKEILYPYSIKENSVMHINNITNDYMEHINKIDSNNISGISYSYALGLNILSNVNNEIKVVKDTSLYFVNTPETLSENKNEYIDENYDLLKGEMPKNKEDLILLVDNSNQINKEILEIFGLENEKEISFDKILNQELKLILNNEYYTKSGNYYLINNSYQSMYNNENAITLKIVGIARGKEDNFLASSVQGASITYLSSLLEYIKEKNSTSDIVKDQQNTNYNVLTGEQFASENDKKDLLMYLGYESIPVAINIFPKDFNSKEQIIDYLDKYNSTKEEKDKIVYTDLASTISNLSGSIMDAITIVLVAFSSISLIVSSIMIGIITYISVLERTKEIGILRALGARKKDITRVFNAETFIIGLTSGLLGIIIACLLLIPANSILYNLTDLKNVAQMSYIHAIILIIISLILTLIGGFIPAKIASKKDPVESLRTE